MGGCASRPETLEDATRPEPLPSDVAEENKGGEQINEAPLVDLSEPTAEAEKAPETETKEAEPAAEAAPAVVDAAPAAEPAVAEEKKVEAEPVAAPAVDAPKA